MKHKAFTMIELIMVIVVLGILASLAIPRMKRDLHQEAADNILSAIRYTQHLALIDDKHKFNKARWQRRFWGIYFTTSTSNPLNNFYVIASDNNMSGDYTKDECAIDPANGKYMYNAGGATTTIDSDESPNIFIGKKYGINNITFEGCNSPNGGIGNSKYIGFDHLGRPHVKFLNSNQPDNASYMTSDCNLTFSFSNGAFDPFKIIITKETGYAYIADQPDS